MPDQEFDERLRADLGAADVRYMVVASAPTREAALSAAQTLTARLAPLVDSGVIAGVESASRYLPPAATQRARQESLPEGAVLEERVRAAVNGLPVSSERRGRFVAADRRGARCPLLTRADLEGTSFAAVADALLVQETRGFSALLPVAAVASGDLSDEAVAAVRRVVAAGSEPAVLLNLKGETDQLYSSYLTQAIRLSLAGFAAIVVLLGITLRSAARVARVLTPLALAVVAVAGLLVASGAALTILHLIGMLLIVAVGSNYALFFDRSSMAGEAASVPLTLVSLLVANLATVLAFGVLAFSRVPVLSDLRATVAPGAALALLFCALLSRPPPPPSPAGSRDPYPALCETRVRGADRAVAGGLFRTGGFLHGRVWHRGARPRAQRRRDVRRARCGPRHGSLGGPARTGGGDRAAARRRGTAVARRHLPRGLRGAVLRGALRAGDRRPVPVRPLPGQSYHHLRGRQAGIRAWRAGDLADDDDERRVWRFLQRRKAPALPLHLGLGREDRFLERQQLLANALDPAEVDMVPGGHDWPTWLRLWENFLDARIAARP